MAEQRRILVTNDDGYTSEGIQVLADALEPLGEVWVVAPLTEQSASSHSLTLQRPLRVQRLGERQFAVDGTPTDCVTVAAGNLLADRPPDVVVSGINFGGNMGADVHYSGTVSAAFEGVILGFPAVAVSQLVGEGLTFHHAARVAREITAWVLEHGLPADVLLNVNVPTCQRPRGIQLTRLGKRTYTEGVIEQRDPRGRPIYWIGGGQPEWERIPGTDFYAVGDGYVSVTPLHLDATAVRELEDLRVLAPSWLGDHGGR